MKRKKEVGENTWESTKGAMRYFDPGAPKFLRLKVMLCNLGFKSNVCMLLLMFLFILFFVSCGNRAAHSPFY